MSVTVMGVNERVELDLYYARRCSSCGCDLPTMVLSEHEEPPQDTECVDCLRAKFASRGYFLESDVHDPSWDFSLGRRIRVLLDGEDVTSRCMYASVPLSMVRLLKHDEQGRPYMDPETHDRPAQEERFGRVKIQFREDA